MNNRRDVEMGRMNQSGGAAANKLTPEQLQFLRKHFNELDLNGDGHVSASELALMFKAIKVPIEQATLRDMINEVDSSGNGELEFDEFVQVVVNMQKSNNPAWATFLQRTKPGAIRRATSSAANFLGVSHSVDSTHLTPQQIEYLRKHFQELDLNGDGHVTSAELSLMFKAIKVKIDPKVLQELIWQADADGNNQIEFDEFVTLVQRLRMTDQNAWVQLLQRTKPGAMQKLSSATADFFGVAGEQALRTQQDMQHKSFHQAKPKPAATPAPASASGASAPPPIKRNKTVAMLRSAVGLSNDDITKDPDVIRQVNAQNKSEHTPLVLFIMSGLQICVFAASIILNNGFEPITANFMGGPTSLVLLHLGAKYAPCMRVEPWVESLTPVVRCPNDWKGPTLNTTHCAYYDILANLCGMGGFIGEAGEPNQYWRFITPLFLHTGAIHLVLILVFQLWRGIPIEKSIGSLRFGLIYFISGIFGVAFSAVMAPNIVTTGPNGALFSILAILLMDLILNWKLAVSPKKSLFVLLVVIIFLLAIGVLPYLDNFMHIGGFMAGIVSACIFVPHISFGKWDGVRKKLMIIIAIPVLIMMYFGAFYAFYDGDETETCKYCAYLDCLPQGSDWCET